MATTPLEVIVQDAEAPVVPSEDGTNNTNINAETSTSVAVPDTGNGAGNIFIGSASSIVLPAILLVVAIGSIAMILIHKYHKQKKDKISKKEKLAVATSSTIAILAVTVLIGNLVIPATKAATSDATDTITPSEDKVSIVITRDGGSAEASIESKATITSTSDFGYKVLLSMAEGVETSKLYLNGDEASEHYIAATEDTVLTDNTWGYALEEGSSYNAVPLLDSAVTVAQGDETVEDEALSIYYGVKVGSDLPAGTYSGGEIKYTLTDGGFPSTLTTMQGMTSEICESVYTPNAFKADGITIEDNVPTATLIDTRDNKAYAVAKLADGKCWMTQNLDLDLDENIALTPEKTNIKEAWTPGKSTIVADNLSPEIWPYENDAASSYDPGDIYFYTSSNDASDMQYDSLSSCVGDNHAAEECRHYHAGNYYTWPAAIASDDTSDYSVEGEFYVNADTSICPAGWRLPTGRQGEVMLENNEIGILMSNYGILGTRQPGCGGPCNYYKIAGNGFNSIRTAPLWLVRGRVAEGQLTRYDGNYWSSTAYNSEYAYQLEFDTGYIYPGGMFNNSRRYGYPIRCLAE